MEGKMSSCKKYDPDKVFHRIKVVEFPMTFVELSTSLDLDVEVDLNNSAYLKTMCDGKLMKFDKARETSAAHRAFAVTRIDERTVKIKFHPKNECIVKAKKKQQDNRFVFDLRLIQVNDVRCCNDEGHAEIGRYYISGQYEFCKISHCPKVINFGDVIINQKVTKHVRIRNESKLIVAKMSIARVTSFQFSPSNFSIAPNSSTRVSISIKPTNLKVPSGFILRIHNPHGSNCDSPGSTEEDTNFISYFIPYKINISYDKHPKEVVVQSLHKLYDRLPKYTYVDEEVEAHKKNLQKGKEYLNISKMRYARLPVIERFATGRNKCYTDISQVNAHSFDKHTEQKTTTYDIFQILFLPLIVQFGKVALSTLGESELTIKNTTKYEISVKFLSDEFVLYTEKKLKTTLLKLKPSREVKLIVFCLGFVEGSYNGTMEYIIDFTYRGKHPYSLEVGNPLLELTERYLKFGMVSSENFITSVPVRIYNHFNVPVNFRWGEFQSDTPFEIMPMSGYVPRHSCKICTVTYLCKASKSKVHEVDFISESLTPRSIPIELSVVTRKLSIKFLQLSVVLKDIPLNLMTIEKVKLENSSREIALFYVIDPLIPGITIEPMCGVVRPKTIIFFNINVKIPCVMEFSFDFLVRINNKEHVVLPISGNVVEPKIAIHPKHIYMSRVPCYMITYVPVTIQNFGTVKAEVDVLDTGDDNIFKVYVAQGHEKQRVFHFVLEGGQSKAVYIKIYDIFRREYEIYIPFKVNGLLGPPVHHSPGSTELHHYIGEFGRVYENNSKVKLKMVNKDICYFRIGGVITVPWIEFSVDKFEFDYIPHEENSIEFIMKNISKYNLYVSIVTTKLAPNFTLELEEVEGFEVIITETYMKFELDQHQQVSLKVIFHPKEHGKFVSTALLYLDKNMTIPYYNLTFIGRKEVSLMIPSTYRVIFPPCPIGIEISRVITIDVDVESGLDSFSCIFEEESSLIVKFLDYNVVEKEDKLHTVLTVAIKIFSEIPHTGHVQLHFSHEHDSTCDVQVLFCITYCQLTLHANGFVKPANNPYPYYPLSNQSNYYEYMERSTVFLEKWMFQQGFRRDLYPIIPYTFHAISPTLSNCASTGKSRGVNVSFLNFVRRIAGPLMKHVRKIAVHENDESFRFVKEIHDTYREVVILMQSRGANLWALQPKYLLSHEQYVVYTKHRQPKCNADIELTKQLVENVELFDRLNKQSWFDFILQIYKVFVLDNCFFDCICVSAQPRDIVKILLDWFNEQILIQHRNLRGNIKPVKHITNLTTDLIDGIALSCAIMNYCPFLIKHFSVFCEVHEQTQESDITNNACLIIDAMNQLKLYFPLSIEDFFSPNFLQMLFLSIHLYVILPMFQPKETIRFNPPLLRSSTRQVAIAPISQETLTYSFTILNNTRNNFLVDKAPTGENGKKMFLNVRYTANFTNEDSCILLVHGYNKTRIFDTYIVFLLFGEVGSLNPVRKCRVTGPLYRPNKVDIQVSSPFTTPATFRVYLTDTEPSIPVHLDDDDIINKPRFYVRRLNLIDREIMLTGAPKENNQEVLEYKLYLLMICLNTQVGNSWIWFSSDIGQFFIRVISQPRWDLPVDSLQAKVRTWPLDPCSCGEACECYRTTVLMIPHRNDLMLKALRYALVEHASDTMMQIFDQLIESVTGKLILAMLLEEGGTTMSDVQHILLTETTFKISSRILIPRVDRVTLTQHSNAMFALPITIPADEKLDKFTITFSSINGNDIRLYRIFFIPEG
ncbi:unnamed protein product [Chrysodeixis includens]|uniref:Calponin-homology (CH) domain-containing protein n=1 Tax=Chrysodeixis includens TaxID=689277 RepID=A0A9P0C056_CHRIL|nr:unnamed protein product [Chrysodeixis includens]